MLAESFIPSRIGALTSIKVRISWSGFESNAFHVDPSLEGISPGAGFDAAGSGWASSGTAAAAKVAAAVPVAFRIKSRRLNRQLPMKLTPLFLRMELHDIA